MRKNIGSFLSLKIGWFVVKGKGSCTQLLSIANYAPEIMVFQIYLPLLKLQIKILRTLKYLRFTFDSTAQQIVINYPARLRWFHRTQLVLQWIYLALMCISGVSLWRRGCHGKAMEGVMIIATNVGCVYWCSSWSPNKKVIQLINALIKFDRKIMKG